MILKNLAVLTSFLLASLMPVKAQSPSPFPDVPTNHWAYSAVMELNQKGMFVGSPKAYDNSTAEACWKSIVKAMERGNETVLRQLMSDEAWKEYTSGKSVRAERLAYFRRLASFYREKERNKETQWLPVEETAQKSIRRFAMERNLSINGTFVDGPGPIFFVFEKGKMGWKLNGKTD